MELSLVCHAQRLREVVEHGAEAGLLRLILRKDPGSGDVDILIADADELPYLGKRDMGVDLVHRLFHALPQGGSGLRNGRVLLGNGSAGLGQDSAEILADHGDGAREQVAQIVRKIGIDPCDKGGVIEIAVVAEGELRMEEIADGVNAVALDEHEGIDHVALGFGHLIAVEEQPAVAVDLLGEGQPQRHEHYGPNNGVEPYYLLAHDMHVRGPEFAVKLIVFGTVAYRGKVIDERIDPDVDHVALIKGHGHAPLEGAPCDAEILAAGEQEVVEHFVGSRNGLYEIGVFADVFDKLRRVLRYAEEIGLLLGKLGLPAAVGADAARLLELGLGPERLALGAVMALIFGLVYIALIVELLEHALHAFHVMLIGGADKAVVGNIHELPELFEAAGDHIGIFLGGLASLRGVAFYFLTVLIRSGQEKHIMPRHSLVAGERIGIDRAVSMPDVRVGARVIDGGRDIILLVHSLPAFRAGCFSRPRVKPI